MTAGSQAGLGEIGQIALVVSDVPRAMAFYRDLLGMRFLFEAGGMAFFDCGGIRLMLARSEAGETAQSGSVVYFKVADIHAVHDLLVSRGVAMVNAPHLIARMSDHELWMCFFRDPDSNLLALMSEVRDKAHA